MRNMGHWTGNIDKYLFSYVINGMFIELPRGCAYNIRYKLKKTEKRRIGIITLLKKAGHQVKIRDLRNTVPTSFNWTFPHKLFDYQEEVIKDMLEHNGNGMFVVPTGGGKTGMLYRLAYELKQKTLIICHTKELMKQHIGDITECLGILKKDIGQLGGGKKVIGKKITVGMPTTLRNGLDSYKDEFGLVLLDELHLASAPVFNTVVDSFSSKYKIACSATPYRKDQKHIMVFDSFGRIVTQIDEQRLIDNKRILPVKIRVVKTNAYYEPYDDPSSPYFKQYHAYLDYIILNDFRNDLIIKYALREINKGETVVIISDRVGHLKMLYDKITAYGIDCGLVTDAGRKESKHKEIGDNQEIFRKMKTGELKCIVGVPKILTEGINIPKLSRLLIATPTGNNMGRSIQVAGRIRRMSGNKDALIYYFLDEEMSFCKGVFRNLKALFPDTEFAN